AWGGKGDTLPGLAGFRVIEFLLKQPGKPAHVLEINRALRKGNPKTAPLEEAFAHSEEGSGLDGFTADASPQQEPCSKQDLEKVKEVVNSLEEQATSAREGGDHQKADQLEQQADTGRKWVREQETLAARKRRGLPDHSSQVEKIRLRLTNNFK